MLEREEYGEGKGGLMIQSISHHLSDTVEAVLTHDHVDMALWCIDSVTADISSRMNCEVYRAILSAQIQHRCTVQIHNDPKRIVKAIQELL